MLVPGLESRAGGCLVQHGATLRAEHHVIDRITRELAHFGAAQGVATEQFGLDGELLHLACHGRGLGRVAAKENGVRIFSLEGGQDGREIRGLVRGELLPDNVQPQALGFLGELLSHALTKCGAIVNDRD